MTTRCPNCKQTIGRSRAEHDTLFGVIGMAFENWPEKHRFQPHDEEELRAWLAIEAGHCEALEVPPEIGSEMAISLGLFFCGGKRRFRVGRCGDELVILRPLTMRKRDLPAEEFREMAEKIYGLIEDATGVTVEGYKNERSVSPRETPPVHSAGTGRGVRAQNGPLPPMQAPARAS